MANIGSSNMVLVEPHNDPVISSQNSNTTLAATPPPVPSLTLHSSFIHTICDSISPREHLDDILEGLPQEYESTTSLISEKFGCIFIEEVETLLLGHEARLDRFEKLAPSTNPPPDHNTKPTSSDSDDIVHEAC
ncbi:hypothetical protein KIW84_043365 [Lathyrus oleraceus]|uniref:Uncharacterized protein n=1 Tax=Pisum sativum TaxID=3888 RepID=A0A9D4XF02_PEA|nr:hypothetical protein KIW84_043365 [Pisum sativum]